MKKLRITPLNIIAALALAFFVISLFQTEPNRAPQIFAEKVKTLFLIAIVVVAFITDMIFRFIFKDLKRIWFVELTFIALTIILFLILQK